MATASEAFIIPGPLPAASNRMPASVAVPVLDQLAPHGFVYSGQYMVEFDADSQWYETSLTIAALAMKRGMKTEYHVFQHFPDEAREALSGLGLDVKKLEEEGLLSVWDSYTATTEFEAAKAEDKGWSADRGKPLDVVAGAASWIARTKAGFPEEEKRWLHLDDNTGIFLRYNDEKTFIDRWRTGVLPAIRARECPHFIAFPRGIASPAFYTMFEALCDGIIDLKSEEAAGGVERYLRIRTLRGKTFDSRWHRLQLQANGEIALADATPPEQTRRLAAIMFTDTVDYTAATQADEARTLQLLGSQQELLRPIFAAHRGREVKSTGDGFLVEFDSALKATQCAVEIQRRIHERNEQRGVTPIQIRVGIHLGDVEERGEDILGDAVNIASRIEPLASPGGVCISGEVFSQVRNKIPNKLEKLPPTALKGLQASVDAYRVVLPWTVEEQAALLNDPSRLAVLPFVNISPDPNDEFFADGLTEEMIARLSLLKGLEVIARTSVMNYKKKERSATQIGKELGAGTLLEGSVRRAGNRIRVTVQLINSNTEGHLWAENYDRNLEDIFGVQSEIAERVASSLQVRLLDEDRKRIEKVSTRNMEAYTLLLKGRFHANRWDAHSLWEAKKYLDAALVEDPQFSAAYAGLAVVYAKLAFSSFIDSKKGYATVEEHARKALELDESLPEAHVALASSMMSKYDFPSADGELQRAIALDPNYAEAHMVRAAKFGFLRQWDRCLKEVERALELDPLSVQTVGSAGTWYLYARQYDKAVKHLRDAVELDAKNEFYLGNLGIAHIAIGRIEEGLDEVKRAAHTIASGGSFTDLAYAYVKAGKPEEARALLQKVPQSTAGGGSDPLVMAGIYAVLGENQKALDYLERAYEEQAGYVVSIAGDFVYDGLHDEPRFQALLKKMNLA